MAESGYSNIREILGEFIGHRIVEITQHDEEYFQRTGRSFADLMFDSGDVLRIYCLTDIPMIINPTDENEDEAFGV
jgi:hypothetical protein